MNTYPHLVACEHCDSVYQRTTLAKGGVATCTRCESVLYRASQLTVDRWLALTLAAAVAWVIANLSPIVTISLRGLNNDATLWEAVAALLEGGAPPLAWLVTCATAMAVIVVPLLQIVLLGWLLVHARLGRRAPGFAPALRALVLLRPWSMVEVCMLAILIAAIKLAGLVEVEPNAGLWATGALMVLITFIANRDVHRLWELTERSAAAAAAAPVHA